MIKRLSAIILAIVVLLSFNTVAFACDDNQTETYVTQVLFGKGTTSKSTNNDVKMLLSALYLCSMQSDGLGQDKLDYLKQQNVASVPKLSEINIIGNNLLECSHTSWENESANKQKKKRIQILQNTVNKVFDFGLFNNWFGSDKGKCNSFAALLYYLHILSDYLADSPSETKINVDGKEIPSFSGNVLIQQNGNKPLFTETQKEMTEEFIEYSPLDGQGRAGAVMANIGPVIISGVTERENMSGIKPSGWYSNNKYDAGVKRSPTDL